MMEILQILKYRFCKERLSFTEDLLRTREELSVIDVPREQVAELLAKGQIDKLTELLPGLVVGRVVRTGRRHRMTELTDTLQL